MPAPTGERPAPATILLVSTADTDLLAARAAAALPAAHGAPRAAYRVANPARITPAELPALLDGASIALVRLLGGARVWEDGLAALARAGLPTIALGGEATPDADLMALSSAPLAVVTAASDYLLAGGPENLARLAEYLYATVLHDPAAQPRAPQVTPLYGVHGRADVHAEFHAGAHGRRRPSDADRPTVGVIYYRAHELSGNTAFVETLCDALDAAGAQPRPVYCASLRSLGEQDNAGLKELLDGCDALIVTVLAAGGAVAADASAGGDEDAWDVGALAELGVPVIQGLCLTTAREVWQDSNAALSPMDAAMQVAIPEFDGRLISVPFSFKQHDADGIAVYVADPERAARVAGIAARHAALSRKPSGDKRIAVLLSSYPTKHARIGNAVGLDTPASAVRLLSAMCEAGYTVDAFPQDGDTLIHSLIAAGGHDVEWLTAEQLATATARVPLADYERWFAALPAELNEAIREHWGEPPGSLYVDDTDPAGPQIVLASLTFGNVVLMIQPPRGFGENPVAIYHDPDLPPSHHYLAAYRWLAAPASEGGFGADALVHLGKHGTLEWLPGKGLGLSASCAPDAVLGDLPLVYPFIVNDPGEGTQAKRRAHATVVDHLIPPMARADSYGDLARLEQLLDEYATVQALDPAKTPVLRAQIWELVTAAQLHHDLHRELMPGEEEFDDFVLHIDGYLCEIKDVQIRDGLHVLGRAPEGDELVNDVLAIVRARQVFGGTAGFEGRGGALPGLRRALAAARGLPEDAESDPRHVDELEAQARGLIEALAAAHWDLDALDRAGAAGSAGAVGAAETLTPDVAAVLRFAAREVVPRLRRTTDEIGNLLRALDGRYVPAGPSGSPTRGLVSVLPTGRNFYSVDPKAIPSRNAWDVGRALAESLLARHLADTGDYPRSVGITVWGTSAMRTQGDDIAEILALLGVEPVWDDASRRVTGFEIVAPERLGRPRVDVTVRISGFFRDAFPHVVALIDDAIRAVADLDEPAEVNHVKAHADADQAAHGDRRRATTRIFGSKPGAYGAGLLPLIDARNWSSDADLAEVFAVWGGYAYGRDLDGREARADMDAAFRRIEAAAKNQDTREHDIVDSDDYFQYHGGMVAYVRALTGSSPAAYVGDSAVPDTVKTRTLAEETHRVFRSRVVNPKWIAAMQRHGYKGAFELAATVDYLFGYDATAGVVDDWMYEKLAAAYVFDETNAEFMRRSNPWALRGVAERLLEAAERKLWSAPDPDTLDRLREVYLELEGDLEGA
ncbi:cobaltochelatase subunit CobN [Actinocrinis puniceicyclus]|uniref:cobaltochelatase subunit CobN n=1 Tax=Actinocrinis puniceicyclus TaxID=977794 RepID=UPI0028A6ACA8|nr:cobaltochelatase subunit CobN [Actinocrinis puniceicyclus]